MNQRNEDLTTGPIIQKLLRFALPLLLGTLVQQLYSTVDLIFVGNVIDKTASAAIGASTLLITCLIGFFGGLAVGAGVVIAQSWGERDTDKLRRAIGNTAALALAGGIVLALLGLPLSQAGQAMLSWNMEEASEAFAAVNAFYNHDGCGFVKTDAKTLDGIEISGRTVGMVGMMIGHSNMTQEDFISAKKLFIMDREEKAGALPDSASEFYLPLCDLVIITGSAAINKTMPRLLELSRNSEVILTGPTVTCCPELLTLGISRLSGRVITESDAMLKAIVEKRTSVNRFSAAYQVP